MDSNIMQAILNSVEKYKGIKEGKNASYIPYLAEVDPNLCALTVVTKEGEVFSAGDFKSLHISSCNGGFRS